MRISKTSCLCVILALASPAWSYTTWKQTRTCEELLLTKPQLQPVLEWKTSNHGFVTNLGHLTQVGLRGSGPVVSLERAEDIFREVEDPESPMRKLIRSEIIEKAGGLFSPTLWDFYLGGPYDEVTSHVPEYLKIFVRMSSFLPRSGLIADLGSGTGLGAAIVHSLSPSRFMVTIERSDVGAQLSKERLKALAPNKSVGFRMDLMEYENFDMWDAAFANNVVYSLPDKRKFFSKVFKALIPGGVFIVNDPLTKVSFPEAKLRMQKQIIRSALENGSIVTEQEIAFLMAVNLEVLMDRLNFMNSVEMSNLLRREGFIVEHVEFSYFNSCMFIVARKPLMVLD